MNFQQLVQKNSSNPIFWYWGSDASGRTCHVLLRGPQAKIKALLSNSNANLSQSPYVIATGFGKYPSGSKVEEIEEKFKVKLNIKPPFALDADLHI